MPRALRVGGLVALLLLNSWSGVARIAFFAHRFRGERALARADFDTARTHLAASLAWEPGNAPSHVLIGRTIRMALANGIPMAGLRGFTPRQMLAEGAEAVARGIDLNPGDAWAWFNLADLYRGFQSRRFRDLLLRRAAEAARDPAGSTPEPAATVAPHLEPEDAVIAAAVRMAQRLEPRFFFYHDYLAKLFRDRGLMEAAGAEIRASFALMPAREPHGFFRDEKMVRQLGDFILAGIEAAASDPLIDPVLVARSRAALLGALDRTPEAMAAYQELLAQGGKAVQPEVDFAIGRLEQKAGRLRESIPFFGRVVEAAPASHWGVSALYNLGWAHAQLSDDELALDYFRRYQERKPASLTPVLVLAQHLEKMGRTARAEKLLQAAVRRFPQQPAAFQALATFLRRQERPREALPYARTFRELDPENRSAIHLVEELEGRRRR
ncbi:MAG: tetratricopeptide repeat protein [Acidobacteriota bacterium]